MGPLFSSSSLSIDDCHPQLSVVTVFTTTIMWIYLCVCFVDLSSSSSLRCIIKRRVCIHMARFPLAFSPAPFAELRFCAHPLRDIGAPPAETHAPFFSRLRVVSWRHCCLMLEMDSMLFKLVGWDYERRASNPHSADGNNNKKGLHVFIILCVMMERMTTCSCFLQNANRFLKRRRGLQEKPCRGLCSHHAPLILWPHDAPHPSHPTSLFPPPEN